MPSANNRLKVFGILNATKKASKAIGFSWGVSEEVGKNIRLLEMFGLPGLKNLNQYFKIYKISNFENIDEISVSNTPKTFYCPILSGLNFKTLGSPLVLSSIKTGTT